MIDSLRYLQRRFQRVWIGLTYAYFERRQVSADLSRPLTISQRHLGVRAVSSRLPCLPPYCSSAIGILLCSTMSYSRSIFTRIWKPNRQFSVNAHVTHCLMYPCPWQQIHGECRIRSVAASPHYGASPIPLSVVVKAAPSSKISVNIEEQIGCFSSAEGKMSQQHVVATSLHTLDNVVYDLFPLRFRISRWHWPNSRFQPKISRRSSRVPCPFDH